MPKLIVRCVTHTLATWCRQRLQHQIFII